MKNPFEKFGLTGKTAVVTGGGTGIGYSMTRGLIRSGAKVMIAARREDVLKESAELLNSESWPGKVIYHTVDLNDRESVRSFSDHALETMGTVDIFIGNAALDAMMMAAETITDTHIDEMFQVNVSSNIELTRAFLPGMRKKRWGRIMFSSSTSSINPSAQEGMGVYAATKGAVNSFAKTIAAEAGHDGITVNSIVLGMYLTSHLVAHMERVGESLGQEAVKAFSDSFSSMVALGRLGRCEEVEGLIQFIASDAGSYFTGTNVALDGGMIMMLRPNTPPEDPIFPKFDSNKL